MFKSYFKILITTISLVYSSFVLADQCKSIVPLYDKISSETLLQFINEVPCAEKDKVSVKKYLLEIFRKQLPDEKLKKEGLLLKSLKLIPSNFDYKTNLLRLYEEQIAGYYDPYGKSYTIANWIPEEMQLPVAMHELTHVIQDQNFNLLKFSNPDMTTDQSLARAAVVEGDATYTMYNMIRKATGQKSFEELSEIDSLVSTIESQSSKSINSKEVPNFLKQLIIFPYANGLKYIFSKRTSTPTINSRSFFNNPPNFTSEILHPNDLFLSEEIVKKECPVKSTMNKIYEDRLGEFFYEKNIVAETGITKKRAWNGDLACLFEDLKTFKNTAYFSSAWLDRDKHQLVLTFFKSIPNSKILHDEFPSIEVELPISE